MSKNKILILIILFISTITEDCSNFNGEYPCQGDQREYDKSWDERSFQTPPRGDKNYKESYQDMNLLVGYAALKYNQEKTECTIKFVTRVNNKKLPSDYKIKYYFGDEKEQDEDTFIFTSSKHKDKYKNGLIMIAKIFVDDKVIAKLELEEEYFLWDAPPIYQPSNYEGGQKGAIVEFFGWPFNDISEECDFLSKAGYMALKVFPSQESILTFDTVENGELNPWWFLYQPVSYRQRSRMGSKKEFKNMINVCRSKGVRVYADAVINHMSGNGNDMYWDHRNPAGGSCIHWGPKKSSDGSPWWTTGWLYESNPYTGLHPGLEFPAVPYTATDFHCERALSSWSDGNILNYGWLSGLTDLNSEKEYVRQRIADYMTSLISMGVSGLRIDAAKHVSPENLAHIFKKFKDNLGGGDLPGDFTAYLEVLFGGEKDLLLCGGGFYSYGRPFSDLMRSVGLSESDIYKIKIWGNDYPKEFPICGNWDQISPQRHVIGLDCHDDQNPGSSSRDMQDKGSVYIKEKNAERHRHFNIELFTRREADWKIKLVMTSYSFMNNGGAGFPDGNSDCRNCIGVQCKNFCTKSVPYQKAYDPNSIGYDTGSSGNWKEGSYTRVHRDIDVINAMRGWMGLSPLSDEELFRDERKKAMEMKLNKSKGKFMEIIQ